MPQQSRKKSEGVPPAPRKTSVSSAERVCSVPSCTEQQNYQSSPVYCSGEHPSICKIPQSQCPLPGCSLVSGGVLAPSEVHHQFQSRGMMPTRHCWAVKRRGQRFRSVWPKNKYSFAGFSKLKPHLECSSSKHAWMIQLPQGSRFKVLYCQSDIATE